jgi:hypothetical protein
MSDTVDQVLFRSAGVAADMIGRKQISSRELTELMLARIDAVRIYGTPSTTTAQIGVTTSPPSRSSVAMCTVSVRVK